MNQQRIRKIFTVRQPRTPTRTIMGDRSSRSTIDHDLIAEVIRRKNMLGMNQMEDFRVEPSDS